MTQDALGLGSSQNPAGFFDARSRDTDQGAALAVIFCFLPVVGERHVAAAPRELDAVAFYERPMLKFDRILTTALRAWPQGRGAWTSRTRR